MRSQKGGPIVRQYNKSEVPRLRWTPQLHQHFVQAVDRLGGKHKATPKQILKMMSVKGLKISHIKSHLQMYRSSKDGNNIDMFVPLRHLRLRRPCLDLEENGLFSLSKRVVRNGHRDWQRYGGNWKQQNFSKESNNSHLQMEEAATANVFKHPQKKYTRLLGKSLKDKDVGGLGEVCELSLSFNPSPSTSPESEDDQKGYFCPLLGDLSHPPFISTAKFSNNYINLDLTISTSFPS